MRIDNVQMLAVRDNTATAQRISDDVVYYVEDDICKPLPINNLILVPEVKGAIIKIAYEATHLLIGNSWLKDEKAIEMRKILYTYVLSANKRLNTNELKTEAHNLTDIYQKGYLRKQSKEEFYSILREEKSEFVERAIDDKTCVNGLWFVPSYKNGCTHSGLALAFDIEGLDSGFIIVSDRITCLKPILIENPNKDAGL